MPKPLHAHLFEMNCVNHIMHGRVPPDNRHRANDLDYWIELAPLLEYGTFDEVYLAEVVGRPRLLASRPGARYRDLAALEQSLPPLRFDAPAVAP
ncbi:hypothetical protein [Pseudomonas typographi]|uniref:hypothetical protein n=1 Tax=Pseudomonas typographi TaxID=2715964 RepID=UPI001EEDF952|nr:hypothetical protein [Pseudomonas typographi]